MELRSSEFDPAGAHKGSTEHMWAGLTMTFTSPDYRQIPNVRLMIPVPRVRNATYGEVEKLAMDRAAQMLRAALDHLENGGGDRQPPDLPISPEEGTS